VQKDIESLQNQSSGSGKTIIAKDKTDNKGAIIANATLDENGNWVDGGNLSLATGELTYSDLTDNDDSEYRMTHVEAGGRVIVQHSTGGADKDGVIYATIDRYDRICED
jgi:hypothetical protein